MLQGYYQVQGENPAINDLLRKSFNWSMPVLIKVLTTGPTTDELPQQTMALYESGATRRIYFNINGTICYAGLTNV